MSDECLITLILGFRHQVCSAGVTGLVSAMGEIAAGASLGAATCDLGGAGAELCGHNH